MAPPLTVALLSCWPPSVAAGSGTTVSQNQLIEALKAVEVDASILYTSRFAGTAAELAAREARNQALGGGLEGYDAVLGFDGEGWLWAAVARSAPFVAFCEAVLSQVLPFEEGAAAAVLRAQAGWERAAAHSAEAVVARSSFAAECLVSDYDVDPARITVLPVPFDLDGWRSQLPALPKEPLVLAAGHTYRRKNYQGLLAAWPEVHRRRPDAELVLVGAGPDLVELRKRASSLRGVRMPGHVSYEQLLELHARASVFCHPSLQENFGIAVVEGLASGAGVVTHTQAAVLENTAGLPGTWAVDAREPGVLAAALLEALESPAPWPPSRLASLAGRLAPARVGRQLRDLIESLRR